MTLIAPARSAKQADGKGARGVSGKAMEDQGRQGLTIRLALGLICVHFIGILIAVAIISKQAYPLMLDENGKPLNAPEPETFLKTMSENNNIDNHGS